MLEKNFLLEIFNVFRVFIAENMFMGFLKNLKRFGIKFSNWFLNSPYSKDTQHLSVYLSIFLVFVLIRGNLGLLFESHFTFVWIRFVNAN